MRFNLIIAILLIIDVLLILSFRHYFFKKKKHFLLFLLVTFVSIGSMWGIKPLMIYANVPIIYASIAFTIVMLFYLPKILLLVFVIPEKILNRSIRLAEKIKKIELKEVRHLTIIGLSLSGILFILLLYGIFFVRFDYKVKKIDTAYKNLPANFNNIKIVQLSDLHIGNFSFSTKEVKKIVDLVNAQNPDIFVFTGDIVTYKTDEMLPYIEELSKIKSKYGCYSILGNHDYGFYFKWKNKKETTLNYLKMLKYQKQCGFQLLMNDAHILKIGNDSIAIVGVENWGHYPFPQLANFHVAIEKAKYTDFKILLSHDPNYWENKVVGKINVALTLSGHTHGAQLGIEINGMVHSPANLMYKYFEGLHDINGQKLYVNTGIGSNGYLGRIGIRPEISVITLRKNK